MNFDPNDPNVPEPIRQMLMMRQYGEQQQRSMAEQMNQNSRAVMSEYVGFLESLTEEQLVTLQKLENSLDDAIFRQIMFGMTSAFLIKKFGRNFFGESADEEFKKLQEEQAEARLVENMQNFAGDPDGTLPYEGKADPDWGPAPQTGSFVTEPDDDSQVAPGSERWYYLLEQYNLAYTPDNGGQYQCAGCRAFVHSLEDRMLREPGIEGCPSCIEKQKWGG